VPDRYVDYVPLDHVQVADRNPKRHDAPGISRSISHHGFAELPLLDERTGRLVAGHGRHEQLTALRDAGHEPPDGIKVDTDGTWHMPVIRGWSSRSDADADAYLVGSNRLSETGGWDEKELAAVLGDLPTSDLLAVSGYTSDELNELLRSTDLLADQATAFLADTIRPPAPAGTGEQDDGYEDAIDTAKLPANTKADVDYVGVSWLVTVEDRVTIREALTSVQRRYGLDTSALALTALARYYLDTESEPA
jgi:hypothetical protein